MSRGPLEHRPALLVHCSAVPTLPPAAPAPAGSPALAPCRGCGRVYPAERLQCPTDGTLLALEGRLLDHKFRLERRVGDGGMASVWQATNIFVHRTVAIKLMHARYASDAELLGRFRNEASAAGKIGSPHICDVLDFGQSEIGPYIVLELLEGCSLAELIAAHRRLDIGLAVWIVRQALAGLEAAHRVGIVHRDLKPEKVFLCRVIRGQWLVKLMDFGISKFAQQVQTAAGATMGTPHYMAPEQIQGAAGVDARADLWSIGVILYEAITSVQLFARDSVADALAALRNLEVPPLTHYAPETPPGLVEIVARCLQRAPERRFASAQALSDALAPFERAGDRLTLAPVAPEPARSADTVHRASAAPRALAGLPAPPVRPVTARATNLPPPTRAPSGSHVPVARAVSGPVAGPGGALPVPRDMKRSGLQAVPDMKRSGVQAVPDMKRSGLQAVPRDMPGRPARQTAGHAVVRPMGPTPGRAWLWGVLLALLGGALVLLAALRS